MFVSFMHMPETGITKEAEVAAPVGVAWCRGLQGFVAVEMLLSGRHVWGGPDQHGIRYVIAFRRQV